MTLPTGTRLGPYEVLSPLGAGGMGEVYRSRDVRLGREVAIKVLPQALASDKDRLVRFEQEARAASALNHPNVVTVHDVGREGETSYLALELVAGVSLRDLLAEPLPRKKALAIAAQIAEGLSAAHAKGIVHRDLKPENVMVTREGLVKILDFGLAKLVASLDAAGSALDTVSRATAEGTLLGTVGYMSPEQASGKPVDFRTDQFSFGAILYEMLSSKRAFRRESAAETLAAIIREEPEPIDAPGADVPAPLLWILERCLAKDPEDRYASTHDLARDLAKLREHSSAALSLVMPAVERRRVRWLGPAVAAAAIVAAAALGMRLARRPPPLFTRLTFQRGRVLDGRFAPDGQTILYTASWGGKPELYSTRADGRESRPLGLGGVRRLYGVSSTAELAIGRGPSVNGANVLGRVPLTGGAPRDVLNGVTAACWLPDGSSLAAAVLEHGKARIEMPLGKKLIDCAETPVTLKVSPDGRRLAYLSRSGTTTGYDVHLVEANGTGRLLSGGWPFVEPSGLAFSPDGREVWFAGDRNGATSALQAVSLDGRVRLVVQLPTDLVLHDIWRDGRVLLSRETRRSQVAVRLDGDTADRDASWLDYSGFGGFTPDGKGVVIVEYGQGGGPSYTTYVRKLDGSPAVRMTEGGAVISPDGAYLVSLTRNPSRRLVVPVGVGQPSELTGAFQTVSWTAWFPDSRRVIFHAREAGRAARVYVQDIAGGAPRAITPEGWSLAWSSRPVSPDGRSVVVLDPDRRSMIVPAEGGEARPFPGVERGERPVQWSGDGRSLYVDDGGMRIYRVDLSDGRRALWREIENLPGSDPSGGFQIGPDERSYGYGYQTVLSDLYLVEGLR